MVSLVWVTVAAMSGVMMYLLPPFIAMGLPAPIRVRVGRFYGKLAARCLKQFAIVRRVLSGYDVFPITVDDEQKLLKVTLSSSTFGDSNTYPFKDPDNRIKRLFNKPVAVAYERVPAAVDAELAEVGAALEEKATDEGIIDETGRETTVDPYLTVSPKATLIDPVDVFSLVPNAISPENVKTAEQKTKKRFEKYRSPVGAVQMMTGALGFAMGVGSVVLMWYIQTNFIDGGGSTDLPETPLVIGDLAMQTIGVIA
jgi:hypothetical protein